MITGHVSNRQALVPVIYLIPGKANITLEHVIDTGFTGELTLSPEIIKDIGLPFAYYEVIRLANDASSRVPVHTADILVDGELKKVYIFATDVRPLLGTALMEGKELVIQFVENGLATVDDM